VKACRLIEGACNGVLALAFVRVINEMVVDLLAGGGSKRPAFAFLRQAMLRYKPPGEMAVGVLGQSLWGVWFARVMV
jgi:hypothetical protein